MAVLAYSAGFLGGVLRVQAVTRGDVGWCALGALQDHQGEAVLCCVVLPPAYA